MHVVAAPVRGDGREAALGEDGEQRRRSSGRAEQAAEAARADEVAAGVDQQRVRRRDVEERAGVQRGDGDAVAEQREGGKHLVGRAARVGREKQKGAHGISR